MHFLKRGETSYANNISIIEYLPTHLYFVCNLTFSTWISVDLTTTPWLCESKMCEQRHAKTGFNCSHIIMCLDSFYMKPTIGSMTNVYFYFLYLTATQMPPSIFMTKLKADRPHPRDYPHTPYWLQTNRDFLLLQKIRRARTNKRTDWQYQAHFLPASRCYAVIIKGYTTCFSEKWLACFPPLNMNYSFIS